MLEFRGFRVLGGLGLQVYIGFQDFRAFGALGCWDFGDAGSGDWGLFFGSFDI